METHAAMRLAVMLQPMAPKATAAMTPPVRQMGLMSPSGTRSSITWASSSGRISSSTAAANLISTPHATRSR